MTFKEEWDKYSEQLDLLYKLGMDRNKYFALSNKAFDELFVKISSCNHDWEHFSADPRCKICGTLKSLEPK